MINIECTEDYVSEAERKKLEESVLKLLDLNQRQDEELSRLEKSNGIEGKI